MTDRVTFNEEDASYTVRLKSGERIVFSGLEDGTGYTITETPVSGYVTSVSTKVGDDSTAESTSGATKEGSIVEDKFTNVEYVNTYAPEPTNGTLTIKKEFSGCTPESGESFVFTVKDANGAEVAEVVIYGTGSKTKTLSLPYGTYTVTEDNDWSWRYTASPTNATAVISADDPNPIVTFTNTKEKKNWLDGSAGVTNNFGDASETTHGGGQQ